MQTAGNIHQASRLTHHDRIRAAGDDIPDFVFHHGSADLGKGHGKGTAESAAGLLLLKRDQLQSLHAVEKDLCLGFESHLTQIMTRGMIGHFMRVHRADVRNFEDIDKIFGELKCSRSNINRQVMLCRTWLE